MFRDNRLSSAKARVSSDRLRRAVGPIFEPLENRQLLSGTLVLVNPQGLPSSNRLIFDTIKTLDATTPNVTDNTSVLTLENSGTTPLTINSVTASGPFSVTALASNTIAAGASEQVTITFTQTTEPAHSVNQTNYTTAPNGGAVIDGALSISSSDAANPNQTVTLAGYWQSHSENNNEPNLTTIVNKLAGYQTQISASYLVDLPDGTSTPTYYGSEVASATWTAANPAQPVTMQTLATYHTEGNTVNTYWYSSNSPSGTTNVITHQLSTSIPDEGQSLLPSVISKGKTLAPGAPISFSPGTGFFGLRVDNEYSTDAINVNNKNGGGGGHHFRFYPVVDSSGNAVPNTYIVAMDYAVIQTENYDFQDNVFILSNVRPNLTPPAPTGFTATNGSQPALTWNAVTYSPLGGYNVSRSTTVNGTYTPLTTTTATSYIDTTAPAASTVYYKLTAVDGSSGTASAAATATATTGNTLSGPVAVADAANAFAAQATAINVLGNDTDTSGSIVPSTVTIVTSPNQGGTATVNSTTGVVTYTSASNFSGTETFTYDERDTNGALSAPATVTITVTDPSLTVPVANNDQAYDLENTAVTVNVLANDDAATTLVPGSVVIKSTPSGGTAKVQSDGTIIYTPSNNFIGADSFTYTVADANGLTSSPATVSVNVGVQITNAKGGTKSISYTDGDNTPGIITLNKGVASVYFSGTGSATVLKSKIIVTGTSINIPNITLTGTTSGSTLGITSKLGTLHLGGFTDTGTLGTINAKTTIFSGTLQAGGLNSVTFKSVTAAGGVASNLIIGGGTKGPSLNLGAAADVSLTSTNAIKSIKATQWLNTINGTIGITAPALNSLLITGEFDPSLYLAGSGTTAATLGSARITGTLGTGFWSVGGTTRSASIGAAGNAWGASFDALGSLTIRSGGLNDDITAGVTNSIKIGGTVTGALTATSAKSVVIAGDVTDTTLDFTAGVGKTPALGSLTITGALNSSSIVTGGNVSSIKTGTITGSTVLVDTTATTLAGANASNLGTATLRNFSVTSKAASAFSNSAIIADLITSASTGQVNVNNSGKAEGIVTNVIKSAAIGADNGTVHLNAAALASNSALSTYLTTKGYSFGDFEIVIAPAMGV